MPLIFLSVVVGVTSIGDASRLGVIGGSTILYYLVTMLLAVILGAALVTTIRPGDGIPAQQRVELRFTISTTGMLPLDTHALQP